MNVKWLKHNLVHVFSREHDIRDDSDSAEDDHSFYPSRPPTVSYYGLPYLVRISNYCFYDKNDV